MGRTGQQSSRIADRYRLIERLGTGGMSVVWRGYDETLGRHVAVKVLSPRLAGDRTFRDRLRQEALAAARLSHPHITGIYDFGESPLGSHLTVPYVVMELNEGESVSARLARRGPFPWREAAAVGAEVASALAAAHARGVVHRDITPANVMLTPTGAKVVDFGISALIGQRDAAPDGSLLGTPAYLAPERLGGSQVLPATDVYALGLLLYRMLTARLPWPAESTTEALRAHLYADPEPLPSLRGMPEAVAALCMRCLSKGPEGRPGAGAVALGLSQLAGLSVVHGMAPDPPMRGTSSPVEPVIVTVPVRVPPASPAPAPSPPASSVPVPASSVPVPASSVPVPASSASASASASASSPVPASLPTSWLPFPRGARAFVRGIRGRRRLGLSAAALAYLGLPGGANARSSRTLRLRAALTIGATLRLGDVKPLGGGLFLGGHLLRDVLTGGRLGRALLGPRDPLRPPPSRSGALLSGRRRTPAALATLSLLAVLGLTWGAARDRDTTGPVQAVAAGALPQEPPCRVRYQVKRDTGDGFDAVLTLRNTGSEDLAGWRLEFRYPGSQQLTAASPGVQQDGSTVIAHGKVGRRLAPGRSAVIRLRGAYRVTNPLPLTFTVDTHTCESVVLGATSTVLPAIGPRTATSDPLATDPDPGFDPRSDPDSGFDPAPGSRSAAEISDFRSVPDMSEPRARPAAKTSDPAAAARSGAGSAANPSRHGAGNARRSVKSRTARTNPRHGKHRPKSPRTPSHRQPKPGTLV